MVLVCVRIARWGRRVVPAPASARLELCSPGPSRCELHHLERVICHRCGVARRRDWCWALIIEAHSRVGPPGRCGSVVRCRDARRTTDERNPLRRSTVIIASMLTAGLVVLA